MRKLILSTMIAFACLFITNLTAFSACPCEIQMKPLPVVYGPACLGPCEACCPACPVEPCCPACPVDRCCEPCCPACPCPTCPQESFAPACPLAPCEACPCPTCVQPDGCCPICTPLGPLKY